jgi:ABC-type amino acid transport substrate-binding protein
VIATEARYAPFEMLEDGKIVGLGKDILTEVMKGLPGVKVVQLDIPFQDFTRTGKQTIRLCGNLFNHHPRS